MNIEIVSSTHKETQEFEEEEWESVEMDYWGRQVHWKTKSFRFIAKDRGKIIGLIFGDYEAGTTYVDNLIISQKHRDLGIGSKLMHFIEKWTIDQGGHKVWLVTQTKWKANDLYKKLGYQHTCTLKKHFLEADFYLYEKFLK